MKQTLTQLILEDIRTTRLVRTLAKIEIDASEYMSAKSAAVFYLLALSGKASKEELQDQYFSRVEQASDQPKQEDPASTQNIIAWLSGFSNVRIN